MSQTVVTIDVGGTGANTAAGALISLGAAPAISFDQSNTAVVTANIANAQATTANTQANFARAQANAAYNAANNRVLKAGDTMTGNLNVAATLITQNVIPNANITYDLGTSTARFKDLWLSNSTIYLGESTISSNGGALVVPAMETTTGMNLEAEIITVSTSANNRVLKAGDTMTGLLNIANSLIVSDNVGIGTATPTYKLEIVDTAPRVTLIGTANNNNIGYRFEAKDSEGNTRTAGIYLEPRTGTNQSFLGISPDDATSQLIVRADGNVGIGTTNPLSKLHVAGGPSEGSLYLSGRSDSNSEVTIGSVYGRNENSSFDGCRIKFDVAADYGLIGFWTGNSGSLTEKMRITNTGNVCIGTTSATSKLTISSVTLSQSSSALDINAAGSGTYQRGARVLNSSMGNGDGILIQVGQSDSTRNAGQMTFNYVGDASTSNYLEFGLYAVDKILNLAGTGNVGFGNTAPGFKATIQSDITADTDITVGTAHLSLQGNSTPGKRLIIGYDTNSNGYGFLKCGNLGVTWTTLALQQNGGNVGIGTTSADQKLHVVGNIVATGSITSSYSDERLKDIIGPVKNAVEKIKQINSVYYRPNELVKTLCPEQEDKIYIGVTAQSVKQVLPEVVVPSAIDKEYDTVQYDRIVALLIAAVQEQQMQIEHLKSKVGM